MSALTEVQPVLKLKMNSSRSAKVAAKRSINKMQQVFNQESESSSDCSLLDNNSSDSSNQTSKEPRMLMEAKVLLERCTTTASRRGRKKKVVKQEEEKEEAESDEDNEEAMGAEEFYVEEIRDMKHQDGKRYFLVKWLNYGEDHNTWEPEENMEGSMELIEKFLSTKFKGLHNSDQNKVPAKKRKVDTTDTDRKEVVGVNDLSNGNGSMTITITKESDLRITLSEPGSSLDPGRRKLPEPLKVIHIIRVLINTQVHLLYLDITDTQDGDELYNVILTEDIQGKVPRFVYGATVGVDGSQYCLIQFDGCEYVDIVPPTNLFDRFPGMIPYFLKCLKKTVSC